MRKKIISLLVICLVVSVFISSASAFFVSGSETVVVNGVELPYSDSESATIVKNDVELIYVPSDNIMSRSASYYSYGTSGGRESSGNNERVWGWSTCYDDRGFEIYHYTVARYEDLLGGERLSSGRIYGYGKVWAYSGWTTYEIAGGLFAKVYYGV